MDLAIAICTALVVGGVAAWNALKQRTAPLRGYLDQPLTYRRDRDDRP